MIAAMVATHRYNNYFFWYYYWIFIFQTLPAILWNAKIGPKNEKGQGNGMNCFLKLLLHKTWNIKQRYSKASLK